MTYLYFEIFIQNAKFLLILMTIIRRYILNMNNFDSSNKPEHVAMATIRLSSWKITWWLWSVNAVTKERCQS